MLYSRSERSRWDSMSPSFSRQRERDGPPDRSPRWWNWLRAETWKAGRDTEVIWRWFRLPHFLTFSSCNNFISGTCVQCFSSLGWRIPGIRLAGECNSTLAAETQSEACWELKCLWGESCQGLQTLYDTTDNCMMDLPQWTEILTQNEPLGNKKNPRFPYFINDNFLYL